ncbi:hypothetical protein [Nisaea sp.]|uniref:hypothetical protein n=1 Tax=Nisaea sp. TaxID=2024842 RepID=UPI003299CD56
MAQDHAIFRTGGEKRVTSENLNSAPHPSGQPAMPTPTPPALSEHFYPRVINTAEAGAIAFGAKIRLAESKAGKWHNVPEPSFTGP